MATAAVLRVYARQALVDAHLRPDEPALLLEGSWPRGDSPLRYSLDDSIDARYDWIDDEASRLAHELASAVKGGSDSWRSLSSCPGPAYLNELKLRYYLVKLLRVVAFFEAGQTSLSARQAAKAALPRPHRGIELVVSRQRDEEYADLFESIAAFRRWQLVVTWRDARDVRPSAVPPNRWWRRAAAAVSSWTNPPWRPGDSPRVVLCGSRRVLAGICDELLGRGARVAWLYDRFAVQTWLRWRWAGVGQLVCNASVDRLEECRTDCQSVRPAPADDVLSPHLSCRGIDLSAPLARWLASIHRQHGEQQARLWQSIDAHFARLRPTALVLDEDATPMARAAVAAARRYDVPSVVAQHGVPRVKFGFAPLAADYLFAWGESSRRQLLRWGMPLERIRIAGWPGGADRTSNIQHPTSNIERFDVRCSMFDVGCSRVGWPTRSPRPEILLFATTPPRDDRPDAVTFHLTDRAHRQMLWMACAAVASIPRARLTIKLHPRCRDAGLFRAAAAEFPHLRCRVVRKANTARLVRRAACVLNCTSSAGIEASLLGARVIELIPEGSLDLLPARAWNAIGTARTEPELRRLLCVALNEPAVDRSADVGNREHVFAAVGREAARRAVDELLTIAPARTECVVAITASSSSSSSSSNAFRGRGRGRLRNEASMANNPER